MDTQPDPRNGPVDKEMALYFEGDVDYGPEAQSLVALFRNFFITRDVSVSDWNQVTYQDIINILREGHSNGFFNQHPRLVLSSLSYAAFLEYRSRLPSLSHIVAHVVDYFPRTQLRRLQDIPSGTYVAVSGVVAACSQARLVCCGAGYRPQLADVQRNHFSFASKPSSGFAHDTQDPSRYLLIQPWQRICVQDLSAARSLMNETTCTIDVDLEGDMMDSAVPGDEVIIEGITNLSYSSPYLSNCPSCYMHLAAQFVRPGPCNIPADRALRLRTLQQEQGSMLQVVANSLCPAMPGYEAIKAVMALVAVSPVPQYRARMRKSAGINVLLLGEAAVGKTFLLKNIAQCCPRGLYVDSSLRCREKRAVPLQPILSREGTTGQLMVHAGLLNMANEGIFAVDGLPDLPQDEQVLLQSVMETGSVPVLRADDGRRLSASISVIATVRPDAGKSGTLANMKKVRSGLLQQFDIVLLMLDNADDRRDQVLSSSVVDPPKLFKQEDDKADSWTGPSLAPTPSQSFMHSLRPPPDFEPLPRSLLREYLQYARQMECNFSDDAREIVLEYFRQAREVLAQTFDSTVTPWMPLNFYEGLLKLSVARARLELSPTVTEDHALDVVEIMKQALGDLCGGLPQCQTVPTSSRGKSKATDVRRLLQRLRILAKNTGTSKFTAEELQQHADSCRIGDLESVVQTLNEQGLLLQVAGGFQFNNTNILLQ